MSSVATLHRTAWLYTRGESSVSMTVHEEAASVFLVVRGPGEANATHEFQSLSALMEFAEDHERQLQEAGFHLQAVAERRSGEDRRQASRSGADRRRRTTQA